MKLTESTNKINKEYEKDKMLLQANYGDFNTYVVEYNETRNQLATLLESSLYYEDFPLISTELEAFFKNYDELINKIMISVTNMDKACSREFMESELNSMCDAYPLPYEKMINIYVSSDISAYNELITNYNIWTNKEEYPTFTSKYINEIIDHNQDGIKATLEEA